MPSGEIGIFELLLGQLPSFIALVILLVASGIVGGAETAIFGLTHYDRADLNKISPRTAQTVEAMLHRSEQLLLTVMFANMAVNALIFTISSIVVYNSVKAHHSVLASAIGLGTVLALVLVSEILAKSLIYYLRVRVTVLIARPIWFLMRALRPVLVVAEKLIIVPMVRLLVGPNREHRLTKPELLELVGNSQKAGYLQPAQAQLLENVVELRDLRVRQVMVPRVNMVTCEIHQSPDQLKKLIRETHRSRIPIYVYQVDYIVGMIRSRRLLVEQPKQIRDILEPVKFVPEIQRVDQLLYFFHKQNVDVAMVVDEFGGLSGMVGLEELMERTIGELPSEYPDSNIPKMIELTPREYLADGHLPLEEFSERLAIPVLDVEVDTLAGLLMHLAGHLPNTGETINYEGIKLTARKIKEHWIEEIHVLDARHPERRT